MKQFQGSLGLYKDWKPKRDSDALSAPSQLDPWMDSNLYAIYEPATAKDWWRIWLHLLPQVVVWLAIGAYGFALLMGWLS